MIKTGCGVKLRPGTSWALRSHAAALPGPGTNDGESDSGAAGGARPSFVDSVDTLQGVGPVVRRSACNQPPGDLGGWLRCAAMTERSTLSGHFNEKTCRFLEPGVTICLARPSAHSRHECTGHPQFQDECVITPRLRFHAQGRNARSLPTPLRVSRRELSLFPGTQDIQTLINDPQLSLIQAELLLRE